MLGCRQPYEPDLSVAREDRVENCLFQEAFEPMLQTPTSRKVGRGDLHGALLPQQTPDTPGRELQALVSNTLAGTENHATLSAQ